MKAYTIITVNHGRVAPAQDRMAAAREENAPQREDFSDLVAKKAREQKRKAESKAAEKNKRQKDKDFRF